MSERRVRLLYTTTCRSCDAAVPPGTAVWWNHDRRLATCTGCAAASGPGHEVLTAPSAVAVDERTHRRHQIIGAGRATTVGPRRQARRPARRTGLGTLRTPADA